MAAGFFVLAHIADAYTTERFLDDPENWERNPILGEHPSDPKLTVYFSITGFTALALSHRYPDLRKALLLPYGALNTKNAFRNPRLY